MSRIADALIRSKGRGTSVAPGHWSEGLLATAGSRTTVDEFTPELLPAGAIGHDRLPPVVEREAAAVATQPPESKALLPAVPQPHAIGFPAQVPEPVEGKLISLKGVDRQTVEEFRRLAGTLHSLQQQNGIKSLMVTSSMPREGKTLTSTNLALAFSELYQRRVLLIDGDLRRPSIEQIFGIQDTAGLGEGLRTNGAPLPVVQVLPRLAVLPAGRPASDPTAGLASERMRSVLKEAVDRFDWVILDSPPVELSSDANLMAELVDGVIFVVAAGSTSYRTAERALTEIGRNRVIGTVLNRMRQSAVPPSGYYDHYYRDAMASEVL
jgi:capsular exopolysaccharide synthesis family protein